MKAGIIGGTGKMGSFLPGLERAGYEVLVSGRSTALTNEKLADTCDLVIVSFPIRDTVRVIGGIAPLMREDQLVSTLPRSKSGRLPPCSGEGGSNGLHPMLGRRSRQSRARPSLCARPHDRCGAQQLNRSLYPRWRRLYGNNTGGARPDMAVVQGLTHFVTICMADSIRRMGIDIQKTEEFMSPVYQIELGLFGRLLSQDPALYADILQQNPFVPEVIAASRSAAGELSEIVTRGDPEAFREFFSRDTRHLGAYCERGQDLTDALIECMVKK